MLHAHKNRPHMSALRNKYNQFFRNILSVVPHPSVPGQTGHLGQMGQMGQNRDLISPNKPF